jgi:hypothetical protein
MAPTVATVCDNEDVMVRYLKAKERLEVSLKLYRLVVIHNISSEIPIASKRVKRCQAVYENLYFMIYPNGDST